MSISITISDADAFSTELLAALVKKFNLVDKQEAVGVIISSHLSKFGIKNEDDEESLMSDGDDIASSDEAPKKASKAKGSKAPAKGKVKEDSTESESSEETPKKKKAPAKGKAPAKKIVTAPAKGKAAKGKAPVEEDDSNFEGMTVAQLKAVLKGTRNIKFDAKMKKSDLVALIKGVSGGEASGSESDIEKDEGVESLTLAQLKDRIDSLNEGREKADKISKVGKKGELVERIKLAATKGHPEAKTKSWRSVRQNASGDSEEDSE